MFLFWLLVGFVIEWAIELWYWRGVRAGRFTAPLEARIKELEEELRRAKMVGTTVRTPPPTSRSSTSPRAGVTAEAPASSAATPDAALPAAGAPADDGPAITSRRSSKRDDLKVIKGVGPAYEDKLFDAGVTTYDALASKSAEEIEAIIRPEEWQTLDFFDWIRQATELAGRG